MLRRGDIVRINKLEPNKQYGNVWFSEEMRAIADKELRYVVEIVDEIEKGKPIYFLMGIDLLFFNEEMLELQSYPKKSRSIDPLSIGNDISNLTGPQEKANQSSLLITTRLPIRTNDHSVPRDVIREYVTDDMSVDKRIAISDMNNKKWTRKQYEKMGIKIIGESEGIFYIVELPSGWMIENTDHAMWNNVLDDKGRKRMSFFYKGSFYKSEAFADFSAN